MATTDDSENLLDHLTERINANGWRVISNPTRQPDSEADVLKTLIRTMQEGRQPPGKRKAESGRDGTARGGIAKGITVCPMTCGTDIQEAGPQRALDNRVLGKRQ